MSIVTPPPKTMTVEEFLALPDDGVHRELVRGTVRERWRIAQDRHHGLAEANLGWFLANWRDEQTEPRGDVFCGEVGVCFPGPPDSLVGIDVAYVSAPVLAATPRAQPFFDRPPVLAAEILGPTDTQGDIVELVELYLEAGVVVWEVDPDLRTVRVHRPGRAPEMFNADQELTTEPELPGFRVAVARLFE